MSAGPPVHGLTPDAHPWLAPVCDAMRRVGAFQLAGAHALRPGDVHFKNESGGESSVVTQYDVDSETMLRDFVQQNFPGHSFLGEEGGNDRRDPAHYWILDPIDGTSNFVDGIPFWGPSLAYWRDGVPQLGVLYFPALDRLFTAVRGAGAWLDGTPLRTPPVSAYSMRGCVGLDSRSHLRQTLRLRTRVRILGSAIANLCWTATGGFQASYTRAKLWDVAAGALLLQESGASVETEPALDLFDPSTYASGTEASAPRITLYARACADLPSLRGFLEPLAPSSAG
jgi:myo-inositol-1(or 4)-monophosphatase